MTSQGTLSNMSLSLMLTALQTALAGAKVKLRTDEVVPARGTLIAAFTEATFGGYAAVTVAAWDIAGTDDDGIPYIACPIAAFTFNGTPPNATITGFWVEHGVGPTKPDLAGNFEAPVNLTPDSLVLNTVVKIREDGKVIILTIEDLL